MGDLFAMANARKLAEMIQRPGWAVHLGDSLELLRRVPDRVVDSYVSDPPAGIAFMDQEWDDYRRSRNDADVSRDNAFGRLSRTAPEAGRAGRGAFVDAMQPIFREALRTMKPGAHGLVWALPRTSHWTAVALEDAGWTVRDRVSHLFGSGMPKSLDLGDGWGTGLKPACEDWWLVRAPMRETTIATFASSSLGGLNIDACRIQFDDSGDAAEAERKNAHASNGAGPRDNAVFGHELREREDYEAEARWPSHVIIGEDVAPLLDACGPFTRGRRPARRGAGVLFGHTGQGGLDVADLPGRAPSRFFYIPKATTAEKEAGCVDLPLVQIDGGRAPDAAGANNPRNRGGKSRHNHHPTVKSIALMRWLTRLITPAGGLVLDTFCGSGTTICGAVLEGFDCLAFDKDPRYVDIARARAAHWQARR